MAKHSNFRLLRKGGPHDSNEERQNIFKCTECGGESSAGHEFNGEPDLTHCRHGCDNASGDWHPGTHSAFYKQNFDNIFPDSPGAGL